MELTNQDDGKHHGSVHDDDYYKENDEFASAIESEYEHYFKRPRIEYSSITNQDPNGVGDDGGSEEMVNGDKVEIEEEETPKVNELMNDWETEEKGDVVGCIQKEQTETKQVTIKVEEIQPTTIKQEYETEEEEVREGFIKGEETDHEEGHVVVQQGKERRGTMEGVEMEVVVKEEDESEKEDDEGERIETEVEANIKTERESKDIDNEKQATEVEREGIREVEDQGHESQRNTEQVVLDTDGNKCECVEEDMDKGQTDHVNPEEDTEGNTTEYVVEDTTKDDNNKDGKHSAEVTPIDINIDNDGDHSTKYVSAKEPVNVTPIDIHNDNDGDHGNKKQNDKELSSRNETKDLNPQDEPNKPPITHNKPNKSPTSKPQTLPPTTTIPPQNPKNYQIQQPKPLPPSLQSMLSLQHSDSTRTLHIHSDIKAHKALTEATDVYNLFYRLTAGIKNQTLMIERERFKTLLAFRLEMEKVRKEHGFKVAMAELNWRELKEKFDLQRRQRMEIEMQMRWGRSCRGGVDMVLHPDVSIALNMDERDVIRRCLMGVIDRIVISEAQRGYAIGTVFSSSEAAKAADRRRRRTPDTPIRGAVATTLMHCVDVVVARLVERHSCSNSSSSSGGWVSDETLDSTLGYERFPSFVPPPGPDCEGIVVNDKNETLKEVQARTKKALAAVEKKLAQSEKYRAKAWENLKSLRMQYADVDMWKVPVDGLNTLPHRELSGAKQDYNNATAAAASQNYINLTAMSTAAAALARTATTFPKYTTSHRSTMSMSQSKYSADKVKARTYSDGSVLPVSAPKKSADGLYMRPAGRQRKGMDWDAAVGKWVPAGRATTTSQTKMA